MKNITGFKKIMVAMAVSLAAIFAISYVQTQTASQESLGNGTSAPNAMPGHKSTSHAVGIESGGNRDPDQFFRDGGRSFVLITPNTLTTNATLGSTVQIPLTLTHKTGSHPFDRVKVHYVGIKNHVRPGSEPPLTPQEAADALMKTGRLPGELDLNSAVKPTSYEISLDAGKSATVVLNVSIPQDWPRSLINGTIPMDVEFLDSERHDPKDFVTNEALVMIHIVG